MRSRRLVTDRNKMHGIVLDIIGVILLIAGLAVATVPSSLRGSGLGTALIVLGIIMLLIGIWRITKKPAK